MKYRNFLSCSMVIPTKNGLGMPSTKNPYFLHLRSSLTSSLVKALSPLSISNKQIGSIVLTILFKVDLFSPRQLIGHQKLILLVFHKLPLKSYCCREHVSKKVLFNNISCNWFKEYSQSTHVFWYVLKCLKFAAYQR